MKRIFNALGIAFLVSFAILCHADSPKYYSFNGNDGTIMSISGDSVFLETTFAFWDGHITKYVITDTINMFTIDRVGNGFCLLSPVYTDIDDPYYGMSVTPGYSEKTSNHVKINIHTPSYSDSGLIINYVHDSFVYETTRKQNSYSVSIPADHSDGYIVVKQRHFTSPIGEDGQYLGKLAFRTPLRFSDILTDPFIETINIEIPNISYHTLFRFYVPKSYLRICNDGIVWFGGMWQKLESNYIETDHTNTDRDSE